MWHSLTGLGFWMPENASPMLFPDPELADDTLVGLVRPFYPDSECA